jgi:hypothetical protein
VRDDGALRGQVGVGGLPAGDVGDGVGGDEQRGHLAADHAVVHVELVGDAGDVGQRGVAGILGAGTGAQDEVPHPRTASRQASARRLSSASVKWSEASAASGPPERVMS